MLLRRIRSLSKYRGYFTPELLDIWSATTIYLGETTMLLRITKTFRNITDISLQEEIIMEIKSYKHNPPHMNWKGQKYFITAASYERKPFFSSDAAKWKILESIRIGFENRSWILEE